MSDKRAQSRRRRMRKHRDMSIGLPPGSLVAEPQASQPVIQLMGYSEEEYAETPVTDLAVIPEFLARWPVVWLNVDGLGDVEVLRRLGDMFGLHRLALEDILSHHQRPKVEEYGELLFTVVQMLEPEGPPNTEQLNIFLGKRFVITFQERLGDCLDPVRKRIREGGGRLRGMGEDYLAYAIVDAVVDAYFPPLDALSDEMEILEDEVIERPVRRHVATIHRIRRQLLAIRHAMAPLRDGINVILRDQSHRFSEATHPYWRDCYDHVVRITDTVDNLREMAASLLDVYLSSVSNRMNDIMKVLTVIATMFIPLTFIAGVYGMNFDPEVSPLNMPELRWYYGYPAFIALVLLVALFELAVFWHKGWLTSPDKMPPHQKEENEPER